MLIYQNCSILALGLVHYEQPLTFFIKPQQGRPLANYCSHHTVVLPMKLVSDAGWQSIQMYLRAWLYLLTERV